VRVCASPALADGVAITESAKCALPIFLLRSPNAPNLVAQKSPDRRLALTCFERKLL
jgi:hypothetical protein